MEPCWQSSETEAFNSLAGAKFGKCNIYVSLVHCSKLTVNPSVMLIYYKGLEPFKPLVVSGSSWELIACCQKGSPGKRSPSLLIVGLSFNSSRLREVAFYSALLGGFKEICKELSS